ncbi:MAG TPA: regulatory protein RecX [Saprospiraceae bacterium]|nr:regulatory protein RecX [Saprospiraceae bacterium]
MAKWISKKDALKKLQRYCAYQDRCHQEVRNKLRDLGLYGDDLEEVITDLITDNFLNEERFARSYARGKFRMKQWGRVRIKRELKQRRVSDYCIRKAMEEIDESDYQETLKQVLEKRLPKIKETKAYQVRKKLADYAVRRGYEMGLAWEQAKQIVPDV